MSFLLNSTFGLFSTSSGGGGGTVTGANNGLSLNGANVVLGNDVTGAAGGLGQLLSDREIDTNDKSILLRDYTSVQELSTLIAGDQILFTTAFVGRSVKTGGGAVRVTNTSDGSLSEQLFDSITISDANTLEDGAIFKNRVSFSGVGGINYALGTSVLNLISSTFTMLRIQGSTLNATLGDVDNHTNGTKLFIDDVNRKITLTSLNAVITALKTNVTSPVQTGTIKNVTTDDNGLLSTGSNANNNAMLSIYQRAMQNTLSFVF